MRIFARSLVLLCTMSCWAVLGLLPLSPAAAVERRVALVIGNGAYKVAPALPNPTIDGKAVAAAFKRLGFEVIEGYDLTVVQMRAKLAEFSAVIPDSKAAVVYYAGHGVSVDEENFLVPTDLALKSPTDLDLNAISLSLVLKQMKREERVNVVILDACRDNPFAAELARGSTRALVVDRGLSRVESDLAKGTLLAFASDPKSAALDGNPGENSPFTKALLHHLEDPGASIDTVMNRVRAEVWAETKNKQMPWVNTSIIGEFILSPQLAALETGPAEALPAQGAGAQSAAGAVSPLRPSQERLAQETRLWDSAERANTADDYQAYLDAYPSGVYSAMARNRIARLHPPNGAAPRASGATALADSPVDFSSEDLKAEIGTQQTEKSLDLTREKRKDVQRRLTVLEFKPGKLSGVFDEKTRAAIIEWQNGHKLQPTGWLGPRQYSALLAESEAPLQRLSTDSSSPPKTENASRTRRVAAPSHAASTGRAASQPRAVRQHGGGGGGGGDPGAAAFMGGVVGGALGGILGRIR
jgi:uncharacterized caspase-like protein